MGWKALWIVVLLSVMPCAAYAMSSAKLHLDFVSGIVQESQNITFSGVLVAPDGSAIPNRAVFIEDDTAYTRPNIILAITTTDSQGKFLTNWQAVPKDNGSPFHFYALFLGGKYFGYTHSETYETVLDKASPQTSGVVPSKEMPEWFKDASRLWSENRIKDSDYLHCIENLVDYSIIKSSNPQTPTHLPNWLKADAKWLSENEISDSEFESGVGYVLDNNLGL